MFVYQKKNGPGVKALVRVDKIEEVFEDMRERRKGSFKGTIDIQTENEKVEVSIKKINQKKGYRVMFTGAKVKDFTARMFLSKSWSRRSPRRRKH